MIISSLLMLVTAKITLFFENMDTTDKDLKNHSAQLFMRTDMFVQQSKKVNSFRVRFFAGCKPNTKSQLTSSIQRLL